MNIKFLLQVIFTIVIVLSVIHLIIVTIGVPFRTFVSVIAFIIILHKLIYRYV